MSPEQILIAARDVLGTPFRHQGRLPGIALDCAGLIIHVTRALDLPYRDQSGYSRLPSHGLLENALDTQPCLVRVSQSMPGDVVLMRFSGDPQHLAIDAGATLIHAYQPVRKVCEHAWTDDWRARIVRIYRFVEVDNG